MKKIILSFFCFLFFTAFISSNLSFSKTKRKNRVKKHYHVLIHFFMIQPYLVEHIPYYEPGERNRASKILDYKLFFKSGYTFKEYRKNKKFKNHCVNKYCSKKRYFAYGFYDGFLFFNGYLENLWIDLGKYSDLNEKIEFYGNQNEEVKKFYYNSCGEKAENLDLSRYSLFGKNFFYQSSLYIAPFPPLPCGLKNYMRKKQVKKILGIPLIETKKCLIYAMRLKNNKEILCYLVFNPENQLLSVVFDDINAKENS